MKKFLLLFGAFFVVLACQAQHNEESKGDITGEITSEAYVSLKDTSKIHPFIFGFVRFQKTKLKPAIVSNYRLAETNGFGLMTGPSFDISNHWYISPMIGLNTSEKISLQAGIMMLLKKQQFEILSISEAWGNTVFSINEIWYEVIPKKFSAGLELEYKHPVFTENKDEAKEITTESEIGIGPILRYKTKFIFVEAGGLNFGKEKWKGLIALGVHF